MTALLPLLPLVLFVANAPTALAAPRLQVDVSAQALVLLQADHDTKGGGVGAAVAVAVGALPTAFLLEDSGVFAEARFGVLAGAGLAISAEGGVAWRARFWERYEPDAGVYGGTLTGALVRGIAPEGRFAADPIALELGVSPLRFRLDEGGFVSFFSIRGGPTLLRGGAPPFFASLTLLEIGGSL